MNRRGLILAAASAAASTRGAAQQSAAVPLGNTPPGQLPPGFRVALTGCGTAPAWAVVDDANVPAGRVLAQTSTDQTDYRFPLAIYDSVIATKQSRRGPGADTDADRGRQSLTARADAVDADRP